MIIIFIILRRCYSVDNGIYDNSPTDSWPTRRFTDSVFFFTDSPTRPLTDTTSHRQNLQNLKKNSPTYSPTFTDSYYSWKMNEKKSSINHIVTRRQFACPKWKKQHSITDPGNTSILGCPMCRCLKMETKLFVCVGVLRPIQQRGNVEPVS